MNFSKKGIYKDENMPSVNNFRALSLGIRTSNQIDVSPAFDVIDEIKTGIISWFASPLDGTKIEVLTSLDNGQSWDKVINGQFINKAERLNDNPYIKLRYIIKSYVSQIKKEDSPKLFNVSIILSDKNKNIWKKQENINLNWRG